MDHEPEQVPSTVDHKEPTPWYRRRTVTVTIAILVVLLAGNTIYWLLSPPRTETYTPEPTEGGQLTAVLMPGAVLYAEDVGASDTQVTSADTRVYSVPLDGSTQIEQAALGNNYVVDAVISKDHVLMSLAPGYGASTGSTVMYSKDSGGTFTNIVSLPKAKEDSLGDQITSVALSTDNSRALFAVTKGAEETNTVREANLETGGIADLFTVDSRGVFLRGYDEGAGTVYFTKGCYNCDGASPEALFVYDVTTQKTSVALAMPTPPQINETPVLSNDLSSVLVLSGIQGDGLGAGAPYQLSRYTMSTKNKSELLKDETTYISSFGFSVNGVSYYSKGKSVFLNDQAKPTLLFESGKQIQDVWFVDDSQVVSSVSKDGGIDLVSFNFESQKTTTLKTLDVDTRVLGVVYELK